MRKLLIGAVVGVMALAVAAVAMAVTQQTYKQAYSQKKGGKSTGTTFSVDSSDASNTANNGQPLAARELDIKFPGGTAVDSSAVTPCKATNDELIQAGGKPACPKSVIGSGAATAKLPFAFPDVQATVTAFNANKGIVLYVDPSPTAQPFILRAKFTGNLKNGPTLKTTIPPNCVPPATAQGGSCKKSDGSAGQEAVLTHFDLKVLPKQKGKGRKQHVLIRTPKKCTGTWKFTAKFTYSDGSKRSLNSLSPCKK